MSVLTLVSGRDGREIAMSIPGVYWDDDSREWRIDIADLVPTNRAMIQRHFPEVVIPDAGELDAEQFRPMNLATEWAIDKELMPNIPRSLRDALYRYQLEDLSYLSARLREWGGAYCGWSRGLGKTLGAIVTAMEMNVNKWVVVGPNSSKESVWRPEIEKWAGTRWDIINIGGTKKQRERALEAFARSDSAVALVHYEGLRLVDWRTVKGIQLVICDEAHRLSKGGPGGKSPQFYKALKSIKADYRMALSGSIIVNTPEDLFGALHWLFPDNYSSRWRDWNNRFLEFRTGPWGQEYMGIKARQLEPMQREVGQYLTVRRKEDELPDLPDRIDQTIEVELSPSQRKVYDDLQNRFIAELPDGEVILAPTVLSQLTKLRQVASGLDLLAEGVDDSTKIDLAMELVEDNLPNKTVVFAWHRATVRAMSARLEKAGIQHWAIDGDVKESDRSAYVKDFQENPETKVIVATIKTLGEAVTLHAASDLIFIESSWVPTDMEQAADRVYRIGQTNHVTITNIVAKDTVDVHRILPVVKSKEAMRRLVLGGKL